MPVAQEEDADAEWPYVGDHSTFLRRREDGRDTFRVAHLNANSLVAIDRRLLFVDDLTRNDIDCFAVTETWMRAGDEKTIKLMDGVRQAYRVYTSGAANEGHGQGVALFLREEWGRYVQQTRTLIGRAVMVRLGFRSGSLAIVAVLYPTGARSSETGESRQVEQAVAQWVQEAMDTGAEVVVAGDFNGVSCPRRDRRHGRSERPETRLLRRLLCTGGLRDIWRDAFPTTDHVYTHLQSLASGISAARLDMVLASPGLARFTSGVGIGSAEQRATLEEQGQLSRPWLQSLSSPHCAVYAEFSLGSIFPRHRDPVTLPSRERFRLDKATKQQWERYREAVSTGLPTIVAEAIDTMTGTDRLQHESPAHVAELWRALSSHMLRCARLTLPVVQIGGQRRQRRHHLPPGLQAVRALGRLATRHSRGHRSADRLQREAMHIRARYAAVETVQQAIDPAQPPATVADVHRVKNYINRHERRRLMRGQQADIWQAIDNRNDRFHTSLRDTLRKVLDRQPARVSIDVVRQADGSLEDRPEEVKSRVRAYFQDWSGPRRNHDPRDDRDWQARYEPLAYVDPSWYGGLLADVTPEEMTAALASLPRGKAAGASGILNEFLREVGSDMQRLLAAICTACIRKGDMPAAWKHGIIHPIPKGGEWTGDLAAIRPITLLETARKLFSSILTRRLQNAIESHGVLRGGNYGFTRGRRTTDFVHVLRAAIDDSICRRRHLEVLLLDVRRAYDSVAWASLERSLERIRVPAGYTALLRNIFDGRTATVRTAHGPTPPYHPQCGLDQGEVNAPILWLVFYDALLCALGEMSDGYCMPESTVPGVEVDAQAIAFGAFADDLTLVSDSRVGLQRLADRCTSFFALHDIEANCAKTVHVVNDQPDRGRNASLPVRLSPGPDGVVENTQPATAPFRLLGSLLTLDGRADRIAERMQASVEGIVGLLRRKVVSDEIAVYIVNAVLVPALVHRAAATPLSPVWCSRIDRIWMRMVKHKAGLPASTPNALLWSTAGYGLRCFQDALDESQLSDLVRRSNEPGVVGRALRGQAESVRRRLAYPRFLFAVTRAERAGQNLYAAHLVRRLHARGGALCPQRDAQPRPAALNSTMLQDVLPDDVFAAIRTGLRNTHLKRVDDVAAESGDGLWAMRPYAVTANSTRPAPRWFRWLVQAWPAATEALSRIRMDTTRQAARPIADRPRPLTAAAMAADTRLPDGRPSPAWSVTAVPENGSAVDVWTDGSVQTTDDGERFGGYAAALLDTDGQPLAELAGRYRGPHCHSDMLEAMAIAHALAALPRDIPLHIRSDSRTCTAWWRRYVDTAHPWERALRRRTPTYKVWETIAATVGTRTASTRISWVRGHDGEAGNEHADMLADVAANAVGVLPAWSLNRSPAPDTRLDLHIDGVNLLDRPERLLKRQSRARHAADLRGKLARRHADLVDSIPPRLTGPLLPRAAPVKRGNEGIQRHTRKHCRAIRTFAAKLLMGTLPTLTRQAQWYPGLIEDARCRRCDNGPPESWQHVLDCPSTDAVERRRVRDACVDAACLALDSAYRLNEATAIARAAVPPDPTRDLSLLLGLADGGRIAAMRGLGVKAALAREVDERIRLEAQSGVFERIWKPRCKRVNEAVGDWREMVERWSSGGGGGRARARARAGGWMDASRPVPAPPTAFADVNRSLFGTERLLRVVD